MTTDLREELAGLAERQRPGSPPPDLWRRGVRRRRVRAAALGATAAAVTVGALLTTVGLDVVSTDAPLPADGSGAAALPDRLHTPPTHLEGTEDGPIGPLAVVAGAERRTGWWSGTTENGTVAVSATTGEYRFLDLPDRVEEPGDDVYSGETAPVLSPDGRTVAYWLRHPDDPGWVGGYAAYDTVTGLVVRHPVRSELGLAPEVMAWAGDGAVVVQYGVVDDRDRDGWGSLGRAPVLWEPGPDRQVELPGRRGWVSSVSPTGEGFAALTSRGLELRDDLSPAPDAVLPVRGGRAAGDSTVSPDAGTLVMMETGSNGMVRRLLVGDVDPRAGARLQPLPLEIEVFELLGWRDADHVVVRGVAAHNRRHASAFAVDVRTGAHEVLVREDRERWGQFPQYAGALWAQPTVTRPAPDGGTDPRLVAAGGAVLVLGGAWGFRRWRRGRA